MQLTFHKKSVEHKTYDEISKLDPTITTNLNELNFFRLLIMVLTSFSIVFLFLRQRVKTKWITEYYSDDSEVILFYKFKESTSDELDRYVPAKMKTMFTPYFIIELAVLAICPIPYIEHFIHSQVGSHQFHYTLSDFFVALMALRFLLIVKVWFNYSPFTDTYSKKLSQQYGFDADTLFAAKSKLKEEPLITITSLFFLSVIVFSYVIRVLEAPYYHSLAEESDKFDDIGTPIWLVVITLTTVGYGDVYAMTNPGRVVSSMIAIMGAFLMALVVSIVTQ